MGKILQALGLQRKSTINTTEDLLRAMGQATVAGESVSINTAIQVSAVLCCVRVIAEGIAQVPCKVYCEDSAGSPIEARDHSVYNLLNYKPNDWQTSFEFREQVAVHAVLYGNAYIFKNRVNGKVEEVYALQPNAVTVKQQSDMTLTYDVNLADGKFVSIPASDIWHIRGLSLDGYLGLNPVKLAARTLGLAQATETFGIKLFENGARPGGILTVRSGSTISDAQRAEIKELWAKQYGGAANAHRTALLPFEVEFNAIAGTANEAQWIENRKFLIKEICRHFRVLPIMLGDGEDSSSYGASEQLFLNHLTHTLMPWYKRFEQSAERALLTDSEVADGYTIRLNANALLRASHTERASFYQTMRQIGAMTANEVRAKEDMPRSDDPEADKLAPAANLFGGANKTPNEPVTGTSQNNNIEEVNQ